VETVVCFVLVMEFLNINHEKHQGHLQLTADFAKCIKDDFVKKKVGRYK
jgi:hypothetical protein